MFGLKTGAPAAAGMGMCGLVGPLSALDKMGYTMQNLLVLAGVCVVMPVAITLVFHFIFKKAGLVKDEYMSLGL